LPDHYLLIDCTIKRINFSLQGFGCRYCQGY
jgi:hypothetical protein